MDEQITNRPIPEIKELDDFQVKFLRLPTFAQDWMCSIKATKNNALIAQKFKLAQDKNPILAGVTGDIILKDFILDALPSYLQQNLNVSADEARQIALEVALKQLLVLREHLKNVQDFILKQGGTLPQIMPSFEPKVPDQFSTIAAPAPMISIVKKPFRLAIQENKEILNQVLTANPIKITDFEQPVRPTIKNWLSDYIKQKGTGYHDEMERSDYLFKNQNAANLPNEERTKLAKILKAYDEDSEMPVASDTKLILIEELLKKESPLPKPASPPAQTSQPPKAETPAQPPPAVYPPSPPQPRPIPRTGPDTYREQVAQEDLAGPIKPLAKPAPRLDGNIVDLKNINE